MSRRIWATNSSSPAASAVSLTKAQHSVQASARRGSPNKRRQQVLQRLILHFEWLILRGSYAGCGEGMARKWRVSTSQRRGFRVLYRRFAVVLFRAWPVMPSLGLYCSLDTMENTRYTLFCRTLRVTAVDLFTQPEPIKSRRITSSVGRARSTLRPDRTQGMYCVPNHTPR